MNPSATPGICRIDQPSHRTHGFFVRVARQRKIHSGFFSDKKYGGREQALTAAQAYHLKLRRELGMLVKRSRRWNAEIVRRKGRSGIQGVRRIIIRKSKPWRKYWVAMWSPVLGVVRKKQISIRKHGEEKAKLMAIRARRAGVRSMK